MYKYLLYTLFILLFVCGCSKDFPQAEKGVLDLTSCDFDEKESFFLNGEWEFYWNQLLYPGDFDSLTISSCKYRYMPSIWENYEIDGKNLPPYGYTTYRLKIEQNKRGEILALKVGEIFTAFRIWVNGKELVSTGSVGTNEASSVPQYAPDVVPFFVDSNEIEIILQISNYHYKNGGTNTPVEFGLNSNLTRKRERSLILDFLLFGSLLIMGLYHLSLALLNKFIQSTLLFGVYCILIAVRILVTDDSYLLHFIPCLSWQVLIKIIVLGYCLSFIVFVSFLYQLFREEFSKTAMRIFQCLGIAFIIPVLFTPASVYTYAEFYFQMIILAGIIYMLLVIIKAIKNKKNGAVLILVGATALILVSVNDVLYAQYLSSYQNMLPLGLYIFILLQSFILAKHFSQAVSLSEELAIANHKLNRNNRTKDKLFSIVAHDLKGPMTSLKQFSQLLVTEYPKYSEAKLKSLLSAQKDMINNIHQLIENLLNWAGLNSNRIQYTPTTIFINEIIDTVITNVALPAEEKNISIITDYPEKYRVYADKDQVSLIIRNILTNAIKFTAPKGTITVKTKQEIGVVRICITDTGVGIPEKNMALILSDTNFYSTYGTNKEKGTGLGLKLCKSFIEENNGTFSIESKPNKGSCFSFTLPIKKQ